MTQYSNFFSTSRLMPMGPVECEFWCLSFLFLNHLVFLLLLVLDDFELNTRPDDLKEHVDCLLLVLGVKRERPAVLGFEREHDMHSLDDRKVKKWRASFTTPRLGCIPPLVPHITLGRDPLKSLQARGFVVRKRGGISQAFIGTPAYEPCLLRYTFFLKVSPAKRRASF